ncbi:hypothetical protein [Clostridium baratii]|uniref:hypothetical protein n=3 Tax=Clostridium baratii TaxID=1561 RepID=UPI0030CA8B2D
MKKKKGSALVVVLLTLTALTITGIAVYSYVANKSKLNKNTTENEILETAALSGLSVGEYYLIDDKNYKNINNNEEMEVPKEYIDKKFKSNNFINSNYVLNENYLENISCKINIKNDNGTYTVDSIATRGNNKKEEKRKVLLKHDKKLSGYEDIDLFLKGISDITILNGNNLDIRDSFLNLNYATFNINGILKSKYESAEYQIRNVLLNNNVFNYYTNILHVDRIINNNEGGKRSKGLNLLLDNGDLYIKNIGHCYNMLNRDRYSNNVLLYKSSGEYMMMNLKNINRNIIKNYCCAIIKVNENDYVLLNNGNLTIDGKINFPGNLLIYSTGIATIQDYGYSIFDSGVSYDENYGDFNIIANKGIHIYNFSLKGSGSSFPISDSLRKCLKKFTK